MARSLRLREQDNTPVGRRRSIPAAKKKVAKGNVKAGVSIVRKRTATKSEESIERPTKVAKKVRFPTDISRKVNSEESDSAAEQVAPKDIIDTSDSDDAESAAQPANMLAGLRTEQWKWPSSVPTNQDKDAEQPAAPNSDKEPSAGSSTNFIIIEMQKLQNEFEAEQNTTKSLQADLQKSKVTAALEQQKMRAKYEQDIAKLTKDIDSEKQQGESVMLQCAELRTQLKIHQEDAAKYTKLIEDYQELKSQYEEEQRSHAEIRQSIFKSNEPTEEQVKSMQAKNGRLVNEIQTSKSAASNGVPKFAPPPSPAPSSTFSFSSDEGKKEENVRTMYTKLRRQYDILASVAKNHLDCTRGMDLSGFGDFGRGVKRLKIAMENDDGLEETGG
ncbi:hypothetical protein DE146DRAFT_757587 [Phaeosphaeria sp. MPI-PUGE-AT-0046c]|nr:hypothetical protein DE146DRAFT_757587 [Phaeosphaeria sp. MPI-PUGE-AT-0046c]